MNLGHGLLSIDMDAWIKAHMLGTLGGFVMMIIMGVSMVLIPMFSLAGDPVDIPSEFIGSRFCGRNAGATSSGIGTSPDTERRIM